MKVMNIRIKYVFNFWILEKMHIDLPEKRYYKIGEVAKAFNVNTSLVRFWEKEFDIIKPKKKRERKSSFYFGWYCQL